MSSLLDRETFTLLNLTESESESVPDLDLVQPSRKLNKRKVKHKRRQRASRPLGRTLYPDSDHSASKLCKCESLPSPCLVGGALVLVGCLGPLLYITLMLSTRVKTLESRLAVVDDASKSFPVSVLQIKTSLENIQANSTVLDTRLSSLETRLGELELRLANKPQSEDVQQNLADFGGKLTEMRQTVEGLSNRTEANQSSLDKFSLQMKSVSESVKGGEAPSSGIEVESRLVSMDHRLQEEEARVHQRLGEEDARLSQLNSTLNLVALNSTANIELVYNDLHGLQVKMSQMDDDNRNISTRLQDLDRRFTGDLNALKLNLYVLTATSPTPPLPSIAKTPLPGIANPPPPGVASPAGRQGPRDRRGLQSSLP